MEQGRRVRAIIGSIAALALVGMFVPPMAGISQPFGGESQAEVDGIRISQDGKRTRMVFELNDQVAYRWFTLPQPGRLVVDFQEDVRFVSEPGKAAIPQGSLVQALRAGKFRPGTVRMVIDLAKPAKISVFTIPADGDRKYRLVVDVMEPGGGEKR